VTEDDISGLSYGYCVELAGENNCPTNGATIEDPDSTDNDNSATSDQNEGSQICDPSDLFCESYVNPVACDEQTIINAIVPSAFYDSDMNAKYNWRCLYFADSFIGATGDGPYLSNTRAIFEAGKIVALEATAKNGEETVTHRFQPNTIESIEAEPITTDWFNSQNKPDNVTLSIGSDYSKEEFWLSNIMEHASGLFSQYGIFGVGRYITEETPDFYHAFDA